MPEEGRLPTGVETSEAEPLFPKRPRGECKAGDGLPKARQFVCWTTWANSLSVLSPESACGYASKLLAGKGVDFPAGSLVSRRGSRPVMPFARLLILSRKTWSVVGVVIGIGLDIKNAFRARAWSSEERIGLICERSRVRSRAKPEIFP